MSYQTIGRSRADADAPASLADKPDTCCNIAKQIHARLNSLRDELRAIHSSTENTPPMANEANPVPRQSSLKDSMHGAIECLGEIEKTVHEIGSAIGQ